MIRKIVVTSCLVFICLFLTAPAVDARADPPPRVASSRATVSKNGVYAVDGYDFFVEPDNLTKDKAIISFSGGQYGWGGGGAFPWCDLAYTRTGPVNADASRDSITVRFKSVVTAYDGGNYDLLLDFSNMKHVGGGSDPHVLLYTKGVGVQIGSGAYHAKGRIGSAYDINVRVVKAGTNTAASGTMLFGVLDLDQPDINYEYTAGNSKYTESIQILSGLVGACYVEPNSILRVSEDGRTFSATAAAGNPGDPSIERAGVTFLGQASGTKLRWAGTDCGTALTLQMKGKFQEHTVTSVISHQQADGSWSKEQVLDTRTVYHNAPYQYVYTPTETAVYGLPAGTNGAGKLTMRTERVTANVKHVIRIPRKQYTYQFVDNKPFGEAVANMPATVKKYAENKAEPLTKPSSTNATFAGWNTNVNGNETWYEQEPMLSNRTYYAQWTPKQYTLTYDKNPPSDSLEGATDILLSKNSQVATYLKPWGPLATVSKHGYVFQGWFTSRTGGVQITPETICKGSATAYARWRPITYTIEFRGNKDHAGDNPTLTGTTPRLQLNYNQMKVLPANGFQKTTTTPSEDAEGTTVIKESVFCGWSANPMTLQPSYADEATVRNLTAKDGDVIVLYAIWDDAPMFVFESHPDRYFTVEEAQNGMVTPEELLQTVVVYDRETNPILKRPEGGTGVGVTVVNYSPEEFTGLTDDSTVSIQYRVEDTAGNTAFITINVYVTRNGHLPDAVVEYYRSINDFYRQQAPDHGGLATNSKWQEAIDKERFDALTAAFTGSKVYDLTLSKETMSQIRDYVRDNGYGNSDEETALRQLFESLRQ